MAFHSHGCCSIFAAASCDLGIIDLRVLLSIIIDLHSLVSGLRPQIINKLLNSE